MKTTITVILLALALLFGALVKTWTGFIYFALVFICALCIYWLVVLVNDYILNFWRVPEDKFKLFTASLINSTDLTIQDIENDKKTYIKRFKRTQLKDKLIELAEIIFALGVLVSCVVLAIKH